MSSPSSHPASQDSSKQDPLRSLAPDPVPNTAEPANPQPTTAAVVAASIKAQRSPQRSNSIRIGNSLLRDYASHLDPIDSHREQHPASADEASHFSASASLAPAVGQASETPASSQAAPSARSTSNLRPSKGVVPRRNNPISIEAVPRQTIMKALASRPPPPSSSPGTPSSIAASLSGMKMASNNESGTQVRRNSSIQRLTSALTDLQIRNSAAARFPALSSPCFFHRRFDDAVNIDKVLEEILEDDCMSHSRLMQTATGVREVSKQLQRRPIKRAVKNVMIVTKARDNQLVNSTRELAEWLLSTPRYGSEVGVNVYVDAKLRNSKRFNAAGLLEKDARFQDMLRYWTPDLCWSSPEKFDLVLTLGGDGTVLFTSWLFQRIVPPILSFSMGSLGFLTNFEFDHYKEQLDKIMGDAGMRVNLRMRFTCTVYRNDSQGDLQEAEQFEVLNELVIDRGPSPYVSNLELYGNDELLTVVQADGCIFSTPTGSTAYSLSAGGSLLHPDIPAILLTPICPHTLSFRPMLLPDTVLLRVCVPAHSRATAYCSFDGKGRVELRQGDFVTIAASQYPFPAVLRDEGEWFDSVRRTLRWNVRGATQKGWGDVRKPPEGGEAAADPFEEEQWDIDTVDSGIYSDESSVSASPLRRQMSMLVG